MGEGDCVVRVTQIRLVVGLTVLGVALGWTAYRLFLAAGSLVPSVPWTLPGGLLFLAALLFGCAWFMYDRVHRKPGRVEPLVAVRLLLLGKASALVGALIGGGYAGVAIALAGRIGGSFGDAQVIRGFVTAGVGILVVVGALLLERACKIPDQPDDEDSEGGGDSPDRYYDERH